MLWCFVDVSFTLASSFDEQNGGRAAGRKKENVWKLARCGNIHNMYCLLDLQGYRTVCQNLCAFVRNKYKFDYNTMLYQQDIVDLKIENVYMMLSQESLKTFLSKLIAMETSRSVNNDIAYHNVPS